MMSSPAQGSHAFTWQLRQDRDRFLIASRQAEELIGRETELEALRKAIYEPQSGDEGIEVVFLRGRGGMGKSRLAEEVLWRAGNLKLREMRGEPPTDRPELDWTKQGEVVVADILDLTQTSYHFSHRLMQELMEAILRANPALEPDFSEYYTAARRYQQHVLIFAGTDQLIQSALFAEQTFLNCYKKIADKVDRLVVTLDTCEKLSYSHTDWLMKAGLLKRDDFPYISHWLIRQIQNGTLPNTTLLLVGRKREGQEFYNLIEGSIPSMQCKHPVHMESIDLDGFTNNETCRYFRSVADSWKKSAAQDPRDIAIANDFETLVGDPKRLSVLWRYTGGQPVRLALYSDLIVEGQSAVMGESLYDTPEAAALKVPIEAFQGKLDDPEKEQKIQKLLEPIQLEIESSFIYLLFNRQGLRAEIMKALARAPRGLNAEQLYYIIHPEIPFSQKPDADELKEIQNEFEMLGRLAIVKPRPEDRLGLQDEVYHIYAIVMDRTLDSRLGEMLERSSMYRILAAYAHYHKMIFREKRAAFFNEDQLSLDLRNPAEAPRLIMPSPNEFAQEDREQVYQSIDLWRKEELHYYLLRDLSDGMNTVAYEVMYNMNKAGHPDDFSDMEEIYQVLYYDDFLRFVDLPSYPAQLARGEAVIDVLRRFMRQLEVTRWLGRFVMRFDTERAETLYKQVDAYIATLPEKEQPSWKHTLSVADRMGWYEYLRIMSSPADIETALKNMEESARKLEELAHTRNDRVSSTGEKGFIGHPGLERIKRTLAFIYNTLGYGYANLGKERLAADRYARAVMLLRTTEDRFQMALVLNNLSRVLSDMGRERARRVCLDALELRKEEGFMVPVAYSTNTLALIDNDHMRPDLAWMEAAMAGAYFRQAGFMRGVGLALIQLGEALRRLAGSEKSLGRALPATPSAIFNASQTALDEAIQIFSMGKESKEVVRRIEAEIEMGCLQRDRLSTAEENIKNRLYKSALRHLDTATSLASQYGFARLRLDAEVNHAWTHYYMGDFARAEEKLAECEKVIPENARITLHHLPLPRDVDSYHFQQLSKMYGLRGRIEMDCYITRAREVEKKYIENMRSEERNRAIDADEIAQKFLKQAAEDYVLALGYAQLFSPRSGALQAIYDALYSRLKEFNAAKVESFYKYQNAQRKKYRLAKLRLEDLGDLGEFMRECIGAS